MCSKVWIISGPILFCHEFCYAFQEKARWKFILLAERGNLYLSWCVIALGLNDVHHWLRHWERWHATQQRLLRRLWRGAWWPISCSWGENKYGSRNLGKMMSMSVFMRFFRILWLYELNSLCRCVTPVVTAPATSTWPTWTRSQRCRNFRRRQNDPICLIVK